MPGDRGWGIVATMSESSGTGTEREVDVVVVGGGSTGENVADRAHRGGLADVVVVENELVGGECSYWACMPSKALLRPTAALAAARRLPGAAAAVTGEVDVQAVLDRRTSFTSGYDDSSQVEWVEGAGLSLVRGTARLDGERRVVVTAEDGQVTTLVARHAVVVASGSEPTTPPVDGLGDVPHWGSREATSATEVPRRLLVLGAGVVGLEMATAFRRLGAEVTVVGGSAVLGAFEPRAGELVADALREEGVEVVVGDRAASAVRDDGEVRLTLSSGRELVADELLVATGRRPRTTDLGLETVGLEPGAALDIDASGRVRGVEGTWLYAAGDVTGLAPLTHMGKYAARAVGDVVAARARGEAQGEQAPWSPYATTALRQAVPQVVFTDPEVASVGLTEEQAREAGVDVRVVALDIAVAGSSLHADGYTGWACLVLDDARGVVVGATFVGQDVAELLHSATVAVVGEVPLDRLWHAVPSYPTISEVWLRLLEAAGL